MQKSPQRISAERTKPLVLAVLLVGFVAISEAQVAMDTIPPASCGTPVATKFGGELVSHTTYAQCEYPRNLQCEWKLDGGANNQLAILEFSFVDYEMPREVPPCKDSFLNFYNLNSSALEKSFCQGRQLPATFDSTGNQVRISFQSTKRANGLTAKGFHLKWRYKRFCQSTDIKCKNGDCIDPEYFCDGATGWVMKDCQDGTDEIDCKSRIINSCPTADELLCKNSLRCYNKTNKCDGFEDCRDGTDELNCPDADCDASQGYVHCKHKKRCYNKLKQGCNGKVDCRDNTDEENCVEQTCTKHQFRCAHKLACVDQNQQCDGTPDCNDDSDEIGCTKLTCTSDQIACDNGFKCLNRTAKMCNGIKDCRDGSDEDPTICKKLDHCPTKSEVLCHHGFACVEKSKICDGFSHCNDDSDENCRADYVCPAPQLRCKLAACYEPEKKCDKQFDCLDGLDEEDCAYSFNNDQGPPCAVNFVWCRGVKKCIPATKACNGVNDCGGSDRSDEENCESWHAVSSQYRACKILAFLNAYQPSPGLAGVTDPESICKTQWFRCENSQYIREDKKCDNDRNCEDGSDEKNCSSG